ncbi:MAG: hypothetical protein MUC36_07875 [Planctomycetes bacterium]|jgi:predicted esterase|nr:hypothetical protein [Planctomycetota bacterium]
MRVRLLTTALFCTAALGQTPPAEAAKSPPLDAVRAWFATPPDQRGPAPGADVVLSSGDVQRLLPDLVEALRAGTLQLGGQRLELTTAQPGRAPTPHQLQIGAFTMPYVLLSKGERPASGWPLYLCLHGGGGNAEATGPHAWDVNTREFQAQQRLFERVYRGAGLYFIPRMADDRQGRWWFDHNQQAFETVIRESILFHGVDADRVYLLGISEGGYGAIRFAGNRPDRFAACNAMAAAEPLSTSPPENMRNVALRIDIGERDTIFDRVGLARTMAARLLELQQQDAGGYDFVLDVQAGRGHGIDYARGPAWLGTKARQPRPDRVVWTVQPLHGTVALQHYWLALPARPAALPLFVTATLRDNRLVVTAEHEGKDGGRTAATAGVLHVRLDDRLADLERPLAIVVNGRERPPQQVSRSLAMLVRTLDERGDPRLAFPTELVLSFAER